METSMSKTKTPQGSPAVFGLKKGVDQMAAGAIRQGTVRLPPVVMQKKE
jgi:hypothetical protein